MLIETLTSFFCYSAFYFAFKKYLKIRYTKKGESCNEEFTDSDYSYTNILYVSLVHAFMCIILGMIGLVVNDFSFERQMTYLEEVAIAQSCGYMIYDTVSHYSNGFLDIFIIWHHLSCIERVGLILIFLIVTILVFWHDGYGTWLLLFNMSFGELTHPFHVTRIILDMKKVSQDSELYIKNLTIFSITIKLIFLF